MSMGIAVYSKKFDDKELVAGTVTHGTIYWAVNSVDAPENIFDRFSHKDHGYIDLLPIEAKTVWDAIDNNGAIIEFSERPSPCWFNPMQEQYTVNIEEENIIFNSKNAFNKKPVIIPKALFIESMKKIMPKTKKAFFKKWEGFHATLKQEMRPIAIIEN